jgi:hypothetical protein
MSEREHKLLLGLACLILLILIFKVHSFSPNNDGASDDPPVTAIVLNNGN